MDSMKEYVVSWLDWGADYVREDPYDFLSKRECCFQLMPTDKGCLSLFTPPPPRCVGCCSDDDLIPPVYTEWGPCLLSRKAN